MKKEEGTEGLEAKPKPKAEEDKSKKDGGKKKDGKKGGEKKKGAKKGGKTLRSMVTTKLSDGSFHHEHHYENADGSPDHKTAGFSSQNMADLQDHMEDHFGGGGDGEDAGQDAGGAGGDPGAAAGAAPAAAAPEPEEG